MQQLAQSMQYALSPSQWVDDHFQEIHLDDWQRIVIDGKEKRVLLNCCRQSGKTTLVSLMAVWTALFIPKSITVIVSPSMRQSTETFKKCAEYLRECKGEIKLLEDSKSQCTLQNGSRIVSLPGSEGTVRGYSKVTLLILDEACRIPDDIIAAVKPFLATGNGALVALSTPFGRRGWFWEQWAGVGEYLRIELDAYKCPRISEKFLEQERKTMSLAQFRQEYLCSFEDEENQLFPAELIDSIFKPGESIPIMSFTEWEKTL
jgi:hypothetical protein